MEHIPYRIENTRSGLPTLIVETDGRLTPMHSKIDPQREPATAPSDIDPARHDFLVVLGCGLGYGLASLASRIHEFSHVVIVERLAGMKNIISANGNTMFLAGSANVTFIEEQDPAAVQEILGGLISLDTIRGIRILEHPQSLRIFPDYYSEIRRCVTSLIDRKAGSAGAKRVFGSRYLRNGLMNLACKDLFCPVSALFGAYPSMDAVVVTSGPGLEESLDLLRIYQESVLVVAADSSLPVLSGAGIHADYVLAVDPQAYITEHFAGVYRSSPDLILSLSGYAGTASMKRWSEGGCGLYLSMNSHPLCQIINELFPERIGDLDSRTGNVAGDAVLLALRMNVKRAALVGFDFSFPGGRIYARGSAYQRRYSSILNSRLRPVETSNMNYIRQGGTVREQNVSTRRSFLQYRGSLHDMARREGADKLFHVREKGLSIAGMSEVALIDFLRDTNPGCDKTVLRRDLREKGESLRTGISMRRLRNFLLRDDVFEALLDESLGSSRRRERDTVFKEMINRLEE